jgi:DNA-binding XRE family transcriptional regulator
MTTTNAPADPIEDTTSWEEARDAKLAAMTPAERRSYQLGLYDARANWTIRGLVYNARTEAGLSQTALAEAAGTTQSVISHIENGTQTAGLPMLYRLADALGKTVTITFEDDVR